MATIKIIPELEAASSRVISSYKFAERRCVTNTETDIRLPHYGLHSQTYTNCLGKVPFQSSLLTSIRLE